MKYVIQFDSEKFVAADGPDPTHGYRFADTAAEAIEFTHPQAVNFVSHKIGPKWASDLYSRGLLKIIPKESK